jgi:hypothetical protein
MLSQLLYARDWNIPSLPLLCKIMNGKIPIENIRISDDQIDSFVQVLKDFPRVLE